ncbi:MAG: ribbon-helix-helix protein, CopG family [Oscillatoriophycideae cyanobacterium NC_groundwater_1537_Pr4_S-0.65um_50_18]|nr:ribbon-helix-helix protein, CopG family [Oscillatoriophycideae cyanobacterium NC_groundwater_1537_Pr4_S-0.65um_50_18]
MSKRKQADREEYGEKKDRINISLTPTAQKLLNQQAVSLGVSRSELIEQLARGLVGSNPEVRSLGGFCANCL